MHCCNKETISNEVFDAQISLVIVTDLYNVLCCVGFSRLPNSSFQSQMLHFLNQSLCSIGKCKLTATGPMCQTGVTLTTANVSELKFQR